MQVAQHIAIVDDNRDIRDLVAKYLSQHGGDIILSSNDPGLRATVALPTT